MYTRDDLPPSYSGSLFRERNDDTPREHPQSEAETAPCCSEAEETGADEKEASAPARIGHGQNEKGSSLLSRLGLKHFFGFDLEDLLILALILILFAEDGDGDLLPFLLILLFTGK